MSFENVVTSIISGDKVAVPNPSGLNKNQLTSLAEFGTSNHMLSNLSSEDLEARFNEVRHWMQRVVDTKRLNAVYLDTTTLYTIVELIINKEYYYINPATLVDLSTFVNSVILYDNIFHLENAEVDSLVFNKALGNEGVFITFPVSSFDKWERGDKVHSLGAILRNLWYETTNYADEIVKDGDGKSAIYYEDAQEIKKAWNLLLGFEEDIDYYFSKSLVTREWASDGPELLASLTRERISWSEPSRFGQYRAADREQVSMTVSECNYRCLFNMTVAYFLRLQYIPNSFRMPFQQFLYKRATMVQRQLSTIEYIEEEYNKLASLYFAPNTNNLTLPFFLSALLARISSLDEFFDVLADMRRQASTLRLHRSELDDALVRGDVKVAKMLHNAIQQDSRDLRNKFPYAPIAGATAAVLAVLTGAAAPIILIAIGVLTTASLFPSEEAGKLKQRILTPQYRFLANMNDVASGLTNAYPKISELWGLPQITKSGGNNQEIFVKHFARLNALRY